MGAPAWVGRCIALVLLTVCGIVVGCWDDSDGRLASGGGDLEGGGCIAAAMPAVEYLGCNLVDRSIVGLDD